MLPNFDTQKSLLINLYNSVKVENNDAKKDEWNMDFFSENIQNSALRGKKKESDVP